MSNPSAPMSKAPAFSYLIPSCPELNALTWMLRIWQADFSEGATIDTVARHCVEQSALAFGEPVEGMRNDEYQRVYMLSVALADMNLLQVSGPGSPTAFKPMRPWYEYQKPAPSPQSARDREPLAIEETRSPMLCPQCGHRMKFVMIGSRRSRPAIQCHNRACSSCPEDLDDLELIHVWDAFEGDELEEPTTP